MKQMPLYLLLFYFSFLNKAMAQSNTCQLLSSPELYRLIENFQGVITERLDFNLCYVYRLSDNRIIIIPPNLVGDGVLTSLDMLIKIKKIKRIPIPFNTAFDKEIEVIRDIDSNSPMILARLKEKLGMPDSFDVFLNDNFLELSTKVKNLDKSFIQENLYTEIGVLIGELLKKKAKLKWKTDVVYGGLNPTYIPKLIKLSDDSSLNIWKRMDEALLKNAPAMDLKSLFDELFFLTK